MSDICKSNEDCFWCLGKFRGNCYYKTYESQLGRWLTRQGRVHSEILTLEERTMYKKVYSPGNFDQGKFTQLKPLKNDKYLLKYAKNLTKNIEKAREYFEKRVKEREVECAVLHQTKNAELKEYHEPQRY